MQERPLSPHIQIYKPQLTSALSIMHRMTGLLLSLGLMGMSLWLIALSTGEKPYALWLTIAGNILARILLVVWTWSFYYHLCNGVRHLLWDSGHGLEISAVYRSGYLALGASVVLTGLTWLMLAAAG